MHTKNGSISLPRHAQEAAMREAARQAAIAESESRFRAMVFESAARNASALVVSGADFDTEEGKDAIAQLAVELARRVVLRANGVSYPTPAEIEANDQDAGKSEPVEATS